MPKKPFTTTATWLRIPDVANVWAKETHEPSYIIEAHLYEYWQEWISEVGIDFDADEWRFARAEMYDDPGLLEDLNDLPPAADIEINRTYVKGFCFQKKFPLPEFWFGKDPRLPSFPGRPSIMRAIKKELARRAAAGELEDTLASQCRALGSWAGSRYSGAQIPKARSIENGIRSDYQKLRKTPSN